ncbi:hypothetical protein CAEBREN_29057 [Caenorhabditis brenneri]|uniref:VWFD domain-containing protein n=1 Tax=Caenorhabditis brenneri TaxID=135651 RepID=G0M7M4_CAEBE|nr:hypothetical protein CAEBREN_29057 [Caenorhabditis brenneri]
MSIWVTCIKGVLGEGITTLAMKSIIIASLIALALAASPALDRTFSPKSEYVYQFDGLMLAGLPSTSSDASQTRISCRARLQAIDDRNIHIQVTDVEFSASHLPQSEQWPKMESLEQRELMQEAKDLLELPFRAQIRNGLISEIQFSTEDAEWSKNSKRVIVNLFSLQKSAPVDEMSQEEKNQELQKDSLFFNVNEKTMEGDCEVAYTIVQDGEKTIYTKSVNFDKCITRPEAAYGLRFGSECKQCEKEGQLVKPQTVYTYTFKNERLEQSEVQSLYTLNVNGQEVIKSEVRTKIVLVEEKKINREIEKVDQSETTTFDNVVFRAPITTCFSLIAKDCTEEPTFAVLAKKLNKNSDELIVKVIRREEEIVVKKTDEEFLVKVDGKKIESSKLEKYEIEILGDNLVVIRLPQGEVRFDGYTIKTNLPSVATKNQLCGLCGNNDGEKDNEFMTADNYETEDVEEFHRSYLLKNEECEVENDRLSEKKNYRNKWNREEKREESQYENTDDDDETENKSVEKTLIKEFSHRICFSLEPVTECRRGYESEETTSKKIRFTCMPRHSENARRFLKESREQNVLDLADFPVSFVEAVKMPTACVAY